MICRMDEMREGESRGLQRLLGPTHAYLDIRIYSLRQGQAEGECTCACAHAHACARSRDFDWYQLKTGPSLFFVGR